MEAAVKNNINVYNAYNRAGMFSSLVNYGPARDSESSEPTPIEIGNWRGQKKKREEYLNSNACFRYHKVGSRQ